MSDSDADADPVVDPVNLAVEARSGRKSMGRLRDLIGQSLRLVWDSGRMLLVSSVAMQILAALALAGQVLVVQSLLEGILNVADDGSGVASLWVPIALLASLTALTAVVGAVQSNIQRLQGERVARAMWQRVLDVSTAVSLRHFEAPGFFDRLQRVQRSATNRPFQVTRSLMAMGGAIAASVGVGAALVSLSPLLLPLLVLGGIPLLVTSRRESKKEFDFTVRQTPNERMRIYLTMLQTGRDEAKEVRAFNLAPAFQRRLDSAYTRYLADLARHLRQRTTLSLVGNVLSSCGLALTLLVLVWLIAQGRVGVAAAGAAIVAIRLLASQVQILFGSVQQVFECGLFLDDVEAFLRLGPTAAREEGGETPPAEFSSIEVHDVSFTYPGASRPALSDVSLHLNRGEVIALVGENGSGKTTLAKIMAGLYDAEAGSVRWDGVDTRTYRRPALRDRIAVIFQDFVRYAFSASENIALGRADGPADPDLVRDAARVAGADRSIESLPQDYDTPLSRIFAGGRDLSGGQWQRVALARAFYRDAPLVILDEPTSALDPRAEFALFASIRDILAGRSVVFISHRFSTVRTADRIYVLSEGRVVEAGSHDELMDADGTYAELFRLQANAYLTPDE